MYLIIIQFYRKYDNLAFCCSMHGVYLFDMLFTKFLLIQIFEILMVNKLL